MDVATVEKPQGPDLGRVHLMGSVGRYRYPRRLIDRQSIGTIQDGRVGCWVAGCHETDPYCSHKDLSSNPSESKKVSAETSTGSAT